MEVITLQNSNVCLSCHEEHDSKVVFCKVCLPWSRYNEDTFIEALPELKTITMLDFLQKPEFRELRNLEQPKNETDWHALVSTVYKCSDVSHLELYYSNTNDILSHITGIERRIDFGIEQLAAREYLALSYYSHFKDFDPSEILEDETIELEILDHTFGFDVIRTKHDETPPNVYTPLNQNEYLPMYHLQLGSIDGKDVHFYRNSVAVCAEIIELHSNSDLSFEACLEKVRSRKYNEISLDFEYIDVLANTFQMRNELEEIVKGNRGALAKDLLICSLYKLRYLEQIDPLLNPSRIRSFQFLRQIVSELKDNVTAIQEGLLVESVGGNCYQVEKQTGGFRMEGQIVFWTVHEVYSGEHICIDIIDGQQKLPDGDYLATIVLSLYDDFESSNLIHTLAS